MTFLRLSSSIPSFHSSVLAQEDKASIPASRIPQRPILPSHTRAQPIHAASAGPTFADR
jgi:hypothetical protein